MTTSEHNDPPASIRLIVAGAPRAQGSLTVLPIRNAGAAGSSAGAGVVLANGKTAKARSAFKAWRSAVELEARRHALTSGGRTLSSPTTKPLAVVLDVLFFLPRPASRPGDVFVAVKPDLSKLVRAAEDGVRPVLNEDSRITVTRSAKVYAGESGWVGMVLELRPADVVDDLAWSAPLFTAMAHQRPPRQLQ